MMQRGKIMVILKLSCLFLDIYFSKKRLINCMIMPLSQRIVWQDQCQYNRISIKICFIRKQILPHNINFLPQQILSNNNPNPKQTVIILSLYYSPNIVNNLQIMNFIGKLQSGYQQLWKYIIRPARTPYSQDSLGATQFIMKDRKFTRRDFQLTNARGFDFSCSLWLPKQEGKYPCVVYLHGNSSNRLEGMEYMRRLLINRIAICSFDFSGCGNAQGPYISLGYYEQQDLQLVIKYLVNLPQISQIALWGRSMGAVSALLYLSSHEGVTAAIFDSPFKSFKSLVQDMGKRTSKVPKLVVSAALKIVSGTIQQRAQFSIYDLNPYKTLSKLQISAFFIVGIDDEIIPIEHTKDIFEAYAGDDKVIKMVKGKHNDSRPTECVREVIRFLLKRFRQGGKVNSNEVFLPSPQSKKNEDYLAGYIQMERVKEDKQKDSFSWGTFFSFLGKGQKEQKKQVVSEQKRQQKKQELKKQVESPPIKKTKQKKVQKKQKKETIKSEQFQKKLKEQALQDQMRQYTYCYI